MEAERTVALLRRMRHDFSNHLQVISGYLELNYPDKAQKYVDKLILDARAERSAFETAEGETALYLFEQMLAAHDYGIKLLYKEVAINALASLMRSDEPFKTAKLLKEKYKADDLTVEVVIGLTLEQDILIEYYSEVLADNPYRLVIRE